MIRIFRQFSTRATIIQEAFQEPSPYKKPLNEFNLHKHENREIQTEFNLYKSAINKKKKERNCKNTK